MKRIRTQLIVSHVLLVTLVLVVLFMPNERSVYPAGAFLVALALMEALYVLVLFMNRKKTPVPTGASDIMVALVALLLAWELLSTKLGIAHSVLVPSPENVFWVFVRNGSTLFDCALSSLELLLGGYLLGMFFGVVLGIICGWVPRLREMFYPIANVLAPIPSVIYTPFLVILMPSYRWAAVMVILLGIFWPQFLSMILRVSSLPPAIVDNARVLNVSNFTMIKDIILPFIVPDVLSGMRVSLTTGFLMLMYAESFGTRSGIGYFISNANVFANYSNIFAGVLVCAIVVTILNYVTAWLQKKCSTWK